MKRHLWVFALLAALLIPAVSSAQKLERTKNWEVGDKATWNYVLKGTSTRLVEEVVAVTDVETRRTLQFGERIYEAAVSTRDLSYLKGICLPNGQACEFSPGYAWVDFPLEKGRTWSGRMTVSGETFIAEIAYEMKVDGVEKIITPAGEFEAYRVSGSETIRSRGKTGAGPWYGTANFRYWLAAINGKVVVAKDEYMNSFAEQFTRVLVSAELK